MGINEKLCCYTAYNIAVDKLIPGAKRRYTAMVFGARLKTDGYVAYEAFEKRPGIIVLNCMAHARRKFVEALDNDKDRSAYALSLFQQLYAIEQTIKDEALTGDAVLQLRKQQAVPILGTLQKWMIQEYPKVLPKSPIGAAIAYSLSRWEKLCIYTTDAILNIDNNPVENAIRPVAIGRKNYLFAGSHEAAQRSAMVYSLFATCRLHNINPYDWLKDVLQRMHLYTTNKIAELLPQNWKNPQRETWLRRWLTVHMRKLRIFQFWHPKFYIKHASIWFRQICLV